MLEDVRTRSDHHQNSMDIENGSVSKPKLGKGSLLTSFLMTMALALHSVLEGAALGAQQTVKSSQRIMIAIAAHKGLAAYALGASLLDSNTTKQQFWMLVMTFVLASPVGIILGE